MSVVDAVEAVAWVLSGALALWLVTDMTLVARRHDEASLVDAPDPLDGDA